MRNATQGMAALLAISLTVTALLPAGETMSAETPDDPWIWLEQVEGERALAWVEGRNEASLGYLESRPLFRPLKKRSLEILDSAARIPEPALRGDLVYNFWQDADNHRGLWRRMSLDDYAHGGGDWEVLLDLDTLARREDEEWVWKGASCLPPEYRRCLVHLSRGGADATVVREFDTVTGRFVDDGFRLEEAKHAVSWADEDALFVGTDFGPGSLTDSGYARTARLWRRGEPLAEAPEIFAGEKSDVAVSVVRIRDGHDNGNDNRHYDIATRAKTFFTSERYLYRDGELAKIDIPEDAELHGILDGQMIVELKSAWAPAGREYPQGALLATDFAAFVDGERDFEILIEPGPSTAIVSGAATGVVRTRNHLVVNELEDVVSRLTRFSRKDGRWTRQRIEAPEDGDITLVSATETSDYFFFRYESFLTPDTLYLARNGGSRTGEVRSLPGYFDTDGMRVEQHFATSRDGTRVPYFLVLPAGFEADGGTPTLLYGYGGFEVSMAPSYSAVLGSNWLARGGAYALANIRGGGEYGPRWHRAALRENRRRAYEDFIAVAEDLVKRGITAPEHLGIRGGSNGGLLTGVMLTQRPDLFAAVVVQVPLLDMKRYHKLLAGASWMGEYGDPDTADWDFIGEYSPYHNLDPEADYPRAFFTTSTRDDRVHPAHARKMVARMEAMGHEVLYYENTVGGHAGAADNAQRARVEALIYTYLWDTLGGGER
ncbi:prolyl oligopeptidase family serine peptidase [Lentisalinibacter salinarum]|uniref:prolyl oligopeptidase family serine peptidase n=1 Tax=Lentisalinibacter salinarum TaxID=2992239 RepID=UPI003867927E